METGKNVTLSQIKIKQEPGITIKSEPMGTPKSERLTSFKLPRDLTLGGLGNTRTPKPASKNVYKPNLNAVRNKNTDVKTASSNVPKGRNRKDQNHKNDRDNRNKKSSLIQTSGIFSEGMANNPLMKSKYERSSSARDSTADVMRRPTYVKREIKLDPNEENRRIRDILKDDEEDDEKNAIQEIGSIIPVVLENKDFKIKPDYLKQEMRSEQKPTFDPLQFVHNVVKDKPNYFLLQMPDTLPGRPVEDEKPNSTEKEENELNDELKKCTINQLEEGYIGKIVRHKSGKVKLILGDIKFDITVGMNSGFLQELVSITTNPEQRSGNIINLSIIETKLNASPDWEYLFKNTK